MSRRLVARRPRASPPTPLTRPRSSKLCCPKPSISNAPSPRSRTSGSRCCCTSRADSRANASSPRPRTSASRCCCTSRADSRANAPILARPISLLQPAVGAGTRPGLHVSAPRPARVCTPSRRRRLLAITHLTNRRPFTLQHHPPRRGRLFPGPFILVGRTRSLVSRLLPHVIQGGCAAGHVPISTHFSSFPLYPRPPDGRRGAPWLSPDEAIPFCCLCCGQSRRPDEGSPYASEAYFIRSIRVHLVFPTWRHHLPRQRTHGRSGVAWR